MCGLAGLFLPRKAARIKAPMEAMLAVMAHRGPDGQGSFTSNDGRYQAGFKRLAIIDLKGGDQPIVEDQARGRRVLMGNGEIYNYLELRQEEPNYEYRTSGDMECVLAVSAGENSNWLHRLNGIYALALYQEDAHRLLLVRDRLGVKPLYYARLRGGGLLFASEIKALFASNLIAPEVDEEAASSYLAHGFVPAPKTLFKGVEKLAGGHSLTIDAAGRIEVERYWQARPSDNLPTHPQEIAEYLSHLLRNSLQLQLRSDVPVGALLSGGIDSGLMVALAARVSGRPLNTYTVAFEGAAIDESPLAAQVAERYGTNHHLLRLSSGAISDVLPMLVWHLEEPLNDAALLPNYLIEQTLAEHVTVALNGTGGDELFAGYGRYFQLPVEAHYLRLPRWMRRHIIEPLTKTASPMTAWQLERSEKFAANRGQYLFDHATHFPKPVRKMIANTQPEPICAQAGFFDEYSGPAQSAALYADINTYLGEDLLTLLDRTSMAHSVEGRVPFLDHRLVEAALAVPPEIRTPNGQQKGLMRTIAAPFLPQDVISAPKQGFASPVPAWIKAGLGDMARKILTRPQALERGWWTKKGVERLLANPDKHGFRVYSLLMLEMSIRIHVEEPLSPTPPTESLEAFADVA
jgi:asparagine synthase (glutamine-hydrolysing)